MLIFRHLYFCSGASGSGEFAKVLNGATALQNTSSDSIDNETITWNWNPQASSKLNFESKCGRPSDNTNAHASHMAHNCYGQKRNRNMPTSSDEASTSASGCAANGRNLSIWSNEDADGTDMKNSNFWSKVLFNNNNSGSNSSSSSSGIGSKDQRRTNTLFPSASNTAVIFNSIISNLKDHHPKSIDLSDMEAVDRNFNMPAAIVQNAGDGANTGTAGSGATSMPPPSGSDSSYHSKSKNLSQKHKTGKTPNRSDHKDAEQSNFEVADGVFRLSLDNDLNAANSTFLRALNDLHLDYNDLTGATNAMINRQEQNEPTAQSKERYALLSSQSNKLFSPEIINTHRYTFRLFFFFFSRTIDRPNSS